MRSLRARPAIRNLFGAIRAGIRLLNTPMNLEKFIEDFEEAVEDVEAGSLCGETKYKGLDAWDSLAILTVIAMVDAEYNVRLKADALKTCETLLELFAVVSGPSQL